MPPLTEPRDSTIAIVGDGFGSLIVYATAVYLGVRPDQITVFGTNENPVDTYQQFAYNLGQTVLRSESESHFLPADWPTFGQMDAWSRKSLSPLFRSIGRKYNPGVPDILAEATVVARQLGWNDNRFPRKVGWLQREHSPVPHFVLYDEEANWVGRAKHVMIAIGHGPLSFPPVLAKAREDPRVGDRIVQAYEPKVYAPGGRYVVVGAGIASVNEWANIIDAGGSCISLLRNPAPDEQDPAGLRIHVSSRHGPDYGWLDVTGLVPGTGFVKSVTTIPLLRRLIEFYNVPLESGRLRLRTNCGIPGLDMAESRLGMMGIFANTVIPNGDTIAGLKYIGRRFAADCARAERVRPPSFFQRFGLQRRLAGESARAI